MDTEPVAHISEDGRIHALKDHLNGTAELAGLYADTFGCGQWGRVLGLWHDLGKHSVAFQQYIYAACSVDAHLEGKPGRVDHSAAGALHAVACFDKLGRVFAYSTQHMSFELTKCCRPPRTSQIPSSGRLQLSHSQSTIPRRCTQPL